MFSTQLSSSRRLLPESSQPVFWPLLAISILVAGSIVVAFSVGCAPKAQPVEGPIADQVAAAIEAGTESFDHGLWDKLLAEGTKSGLVDYDYFETHRAELERYLGRIAEADLSVLTRDHLLALLINAYNAYTIQSILDHPGIESIREIDGVWDSRTHTVGGFEMTLDNIEHNVIRPFFKDPRIHFAVNCASRSCAPLPPWAFNGNLLESQLENWTQAFLTDPRYTRIEGQTLYLSQLLDWYGEDFTLEQSSPRADSIVDFVSRYSPEVAHRKGELQVEFADYDWSLNRADS